MKSINEVYVNGICLKEILEKHKKWLNNEGGGERAYLKGTDLSKVNLKGVDLRHANLSYANLNRSDLEGVDLSCADLDSKEQIRRGIMLDKPMKGYKKCLNDIIVELEIPKGAIVFSINNYKCRTNCAKVVRIFNSQGDNLNIAKSKFDRTFKYKVGKTYTITNFNSNYSVECGAGIHFFRSEEEARNYNI